MIPTPALCWSSSFSLPEYRSVCPVDNDILPKIFHLTSLRPSTSILYLSISLATCAHFPVWYIVRTFHVSSLVRDFVESNLFIGLSIIHCLLLTRSSEWTNSTSSSTTCSGTVVVAVTILDVSVTSWKSTEWGIDPSSFTRTPYPWETAIPCWGWVLPIQGRQTVPHSSMSLEDDIHEDRKSYNLAWLENPLSPSFSCLGSAQRWLRDAKGLWGREWHRGWYVKVWGWGRHVSEGKDIHHLHVHVDHFNVQQAQTALLQTRPKQI